MNMGKSGRKSKTARKQRRLPFSSGGDADEGDSGEFLPSSAYDLAGDDRERSDGSGSGARGVAEEKDDFGDEGTDGIETTVGVPSKFDLYQKSVQSPKGDISYLKKFFLMYVGGRQPLHLQEDFCGTALLSSEWLRSDLRRTVVGLDLDLEALNWCLENNISKICSNASSRISLFHGNVLHPFKANKVKHPFDPTRNVESMGLNKQKDSSEIAKLLNETGSSSPACFTMEEATLPPKDIICALNYSCCCLQRRIDLIRYFKHTLNALSKKGGIFVMDLYGGTSSERKLQLKRKFSNFTYIWEQEEFDIISRRTRISLHFHLGKKHILRHAFSYDWRLWSLPEIKECLEEAGFQSVHFWMREMPNTEEDEHSEEYDADGNVKYEEFSAFKQRDAWNAYVVAAANL
ncbi:hypothetical protein AXF42_Ash004664 [Apostasia shenzhenica]|uniref:Uncharacterized protein n=1 Tax=Apostasia shenzhenica TaxID=1088818 RepID=A0A2I0BHA4_9ASPA|nr:hypothetical protein AXF42_Ash004664 [Apostasia shenzhenica]